MKPATIPCSKCGGTGKAPLPAVLQPVLALLKKRGGATRDDIHKLAPARLSTAMNNRLERLRDFGLVKRKKVGRKFVYTAK